MSARGVRWPVLPGMIALAAAAPAPAQIVSPAPEAVAVTIYRAPDRSADSAIDRAWLRGYALVTEQRRVRVPAGRTVLRFEGVAAGILPESAIVTGLPQGVREKNVDADLLSPRSLFARGFGRPVTIRRAIGKKVIEEPAIIRSGPDGAAILQTSAGFEAVTCGPQTESLVYDRVPAGLSAKPTLSVELDAPVAAEVTVTLSYLAWGFDWQANYVATLRPEGGRPGGQSADLIAWVTLASSDTTSFPAAETMVVAGKVKREDSAPYPNAQRRVEPLIFYCFAHPGPQPPPPPPPPSAFAEGDIIVTANRVMAVPVAAPAAVRQEDLGDLKLYRVPDRTTVAALAQKQVALLERESVPVSLVYVARVDGDGDAGTPQITLRMRNRKDAGLGLPLPAGPVALFQPRGGARLLLGEGTIDDKAVGEEVEATIAEATQVTIESAKSQSGKGWAGHVLTVRNANRYPIPFEGQFAAEDFPRMSLLSGTLVPKDSKMLWKTIIPENGTRTFSYRIKDRD